MKKTLILATAIALTALSTTATAGQAFVRAEVGSSDTELSVGRYSASDTTTSLVVGGGYWFNPNFAVEGHVGTLYNEDLGYDRELDLVTMGVGVVGKMHFAANDTGFFIGARAGISRLTAQVREDTWDVEDDESSTKPYYGAFVGYDFNKRWGMSLNYDRRKGDFDGVDLKNETISLGGEFRF